MRRGGQPGLPTGGVELQVDELEILSRSTPLPFQLDEEGVDENLRLRYRWLDLRSPRMQRNLRLSHTVIQSIRRTMDERGFVDVWTPSMTRGTPEGARDFLVPVRLQPGKFFALAQSPQLFKQLCMIGGLDRYYQIATCWRDEDLRADRQFEFRQLDLEMAFVEREDVLDVMEAAVVNAFAASAASRPRGRSRGSAYDEAIARYGTDKPDLRFGLEIQDATEVTRGSEFGVFAGAEAVRFIVVPREYSRAELARLEEVAKEWGAKGLAYIVHDGDGARSPIAKFLSERELRVPRRPDRPCCSPRASRRCRARARRAAPPSGARARARRSGRGRLPLGGRLPALPAGRGHGPVDVPAPSFHRAGPRGRGRFEGDPGAALSQHYDLIWNGWELGSGSIRIHRSDVQPAVFRTMGMSDEEANGKFGFLLEALEMGAPPHGGFAMGLERFVA